MDVQGGHRIEYDDRPVCPVVCLTSPTGRQAETPVVSFSKLSAHSNSDVDAG